MNIKPLSLLVCATLLLESATSQEALPLVLEMAQNDFEKEVKALAENQPDDLNEKYVAGIERLAAEAQAGGELEALIELRKEIESIVETGRVSGLKPNGSEFSNLREIYRDQRALWENQRIDHFNQLRARHLERLEDMKVEMTQAGEIDDALATKEEIDRLQQMTLGVMVGSVVTLSDGVAQGRLRGGGWLSKRNGFNDGSMIDLTPLQRFEDWVEIEGDHYGILFRRANGDLYNQHAELVDSDVVRILINPNSGGYLTRDGVFHPLWQADLSGKPGELTQWVEQQSRGLGRLSDGSLYWYGGVYGTERMEPPMEVRTDVKQVGIYGIRDMVLKNDGTLLIWDQKQMIPLRSGLDGPVRQLDNRGWVFQALMEDGTLRNYEGKLVSWAPAGIQWMLDGNDVAAFLLEDNLWQIRSSRGKLPEELEGVSIALNRPETVDVGFFVSGPQRPRPESTIWGIWIEDVGATEIDPASSSQVEPRAKPVNSVYGLTWD